MSTTSRPDVALSAFELTDGYRVGDLDPVEVAREVLELAARAGHELNAVAALADRDEVLAAADASRRRWREGAPLGPLDGVPVSVKESIPMRGFPWRHGSAAHDALYPDHDAPIVRRLAEGGALLFATTVMPDFGMGAGGVSSAYGVVRNPWNRASTTGGSSAGAAALVAAGVGAAAVGTDMGGSVRLPAAHQGLFGFKPTQGLIAYSPSPVRSAGPLARTLADMEALLAVIGQEDAADLSCLPGRYRPASPIDLRGRRVGVIRQMGIGLEAGPTEIAAVETQALALARLGAEVVDIDEVGLDDEDERALETYFRVKGLSELHRIAPERRSLLLPPIAAELDRAYGLSALAFAQATDRLESAKSRFKRHLEEFEFLLSPVMPVASFPAESLKPAGSPSAFAHVHYTAWYNQTGHPAGVVPSGLVSGGVPVGVQIAARRFRDADLVQLMRALEQETDPLTYPVLAGTTAAGTP